MNIFPLVSNALMAAAGEKDTGATDQEIHQNRSRHFVRNLAALMRDSFRHDDSICVLDKSCEGHRERFGSNELLFDILACRTDKVLSASHKAHLTYITEGLWAVESEVERNSRQAVYDFNKLVLADCAEKLFVGPITEDVDAFIETLAAPADKCKGNVCLALITHPGEWQKSLSLRCFNRNNGTWLETLAT